tara:strand:- start:1953 stop:2531 length:579 start_codon:yes stop_codon:yes gene_type:complete
MGGNMINQQWLFFKGAIDSDWCDEYVEHALTNYTAVESTIGFENSRTDPDYRQCDIRWLDTGREKGLVDMLWGYVNRANRDSFDVDIRYINELQFTSYYGETLGKYGWHHDVDFKNPAPWHRKLSMTVQLSDPADYEGGEFEFQDDIDQLPPEYTEKGTVLVFPSFYKHQVKPVTKGTRHSLVSWVEGPHWR